MRTITWTADKSSAIAPGQYQEFSISAGPLPAPGTLVLPVTQTYSDGDVVAWDDPGKAGGAEPEHPGPHFEITPAGAAAPASGTGDDAASPGSSSPSDTTARVLAGGALLVALLAAAAQVLRRRPRPRVA